MKELDNKQKIIIIAVVAIIAGAILYYVYGKDSTQNKNEILPYDEENILETEENKNGENANTTKEEDSNKGGVNEAEIVIYITGEVNKEGVYGLPEGSRVADAIEQAGGLTENAYTEDLNLAYLLEDGMKIKVPNIEDIEDMEDIEEQEENEEDNYITKDSGIFITGASIETNNSLNKKVNINTASQQELESVTGIGPSTASKIIQYRKENGNFKNIEEIKNVSGIGDSKYEGMKNEICVK